MGFYEEIDGSLKVKKGTASNMIAGIRVSGTNIQSNFVSGNLLELPNGQLVAPYAPQVSGGSYILVRQDTKDNDTIDITFVCPEAKGRFPNKGQDQPWHHQDPNKEEFYYREFLLGSGCRVQFGIGSGLSENKFYSKFLDKTNEN